MPIKLIIYFSLALFLTSCIGDALVTVKYSIKNKTDKPITVKSKTNWADRNTGRDTSVFIPPHSEKTIYAIRLVCGFSDCRYHIKNDHFLDSVEYYFTEKPEQYFKLVSDRWKIKKHSAKAIIK